MSKSEIEMRNRDLRKEFNALRKNGMFIKEILPILAEKFAVKENYVVSIAYGKDRAI